MSRKDKDYYIFQIEDPMSEMNGLWCVEVWKDGKPRILFTDMYKSVCEKYVQLMKGAE